MAAGADDMAASRLTEDLILEILSRLPIKSLRRFKCVSRCWRDLISYSDVLRKLPQTLEGFFYASIDGERIPQSTLHYANISGQPDPLICLEFVPSHRGIELLDCCNGLLLCRWCAKDDRYIVCNPVTKKWVVFPISSQAKDAGNVRLGFDPAVSPHFHVFELLEEQFDVIMTRMEVYSSSETARWVSMESGLIENIFLGLGDRLSPAVFLNGRLHFHTSDYGGLDHGNSLGVVDTAGATWTNFPVPHSIARPFFQLSQGRLHYACFDLDYDDVIWLQVYVLEDYDSQEWILKHSIESSYVFGEIKVEFTGLFDWIAIHPECNTIFFTAGLYNTFMSYNMDTQQVKVLRDQLLGDMPYLPYVPFYSELPALQM